MERHLRVNRVVDTPADFVLELLDQTSDHHQSWYARRIKVPVMAGRRVWRLVRVHTSNPVDVDECTRLMDFEFADARFRALFPTFHGQLEVTALDDDRTELVITGNYRPPFGVAGTLIDTVGIGRIFGRGGVSSLLDDLVEHIAYTRVEAGRLTD